MALAANFLISEFLADNDGPFVDNYGVESDWIEIHNAGDAAGSLSGFYLTDDAANLRKWQFPGVSVPSGGRLVVFASGEDDRVVGQPLHTNFALASEGEYLALVAPDGVTVLDDFGPQFPPQRSGVSYGVGQVVDAATYVAPGAAARTYVATTGAYDGLWTASGFVPDANWLSGATGVGYAETTAGFLVRTYQANTAANSPIGETLDNIDEVLELVGNSAAYSSVAAGNYATVNFVNTGSGGNYAGSVAYPGLDTTTDYNHIASEVQATVTIPAAGAWTFGVSSNEGFLLQVGDFEIQRYGTGNADQFATFTFDAPGDYQLRLYNFERTGSTWLELYAAPGVHAAWSGGAFDLVGDVAAGGLAVKADVVGSGGGSFTQLIGTDLEAVMKGASSSFYTRVPFQAANPAAYDQLRLRIKYDDGFVAYLNGQEVARRNFVGAPAWNSQAAGPRSGDEPLAYEDIDLAAHRSALVAGANVLAIHGLNVSATDGDALALPELIALDVLATNAAYFSTPTPGAANNAGFVDFVAAPQFSADRGFYDAPFQLAISSPTPGAQIYYTTNGEPPTPSAGTLYAGPIAITGSVAVRAAAFRSGFLPTDVVTQTYLFLNDVVRQDYAATLAAGFPASWGGIAPDYGMDPDVIGSFDAAGNSLGGDKFGGQYAATIKSDLRALPTLSIVMDVDDMFGPSGIYTNSTQRGSAWERAASVEWITADNSLEFHVNAGIRVQGGAFRSDGLTKKHSLRLLFKNEYGPGKLRQPIFGGDGVADEFNTIVLRAGANDGYAWDAARFTEQYVRDEFGRSLQRDAGAPSPHGAFVHLYVNGVYWGLYNPVERPDNEFGASYIGGRADNWDSIHVDETPAGDDAAWNAMLAKAAQAGSSLAAFMELQGKNPDGAPNPSLAPLLHVNRYIDYIAINVWGGNWDWPFKNFWAGRDRDPATTLGFQFFNWDFENTMGNNRDRSPLNARTLDQGFTGQRNAGQAHSSLRTNPEYRMAFADHVQKLFFNGGLLTPQTLIPRYAALAERVERAMVAESARWGDTHYSTAPLTLANWKTERDWMLNTYLPQRSAIVLQELIAYGLYPTVAAPTFSQHGGQVTPGFDLTLSAPAGTIWYTLDGSDPRQIGGAVSSAAVAYTGAAIDIPAGRTVRARALLGGSWSALNEAAFTVAAPADATNLRIVEVHYNPAPQAGVVDEQNLEFIELVNPGSLPVSLDGVTITQFIATPYAFPAGLTLNAGERLVVARSPSALQAVYGGEFRVAPTGYADANLANSGERVALVGPHGDVLQDFTYDDSAGWPALADGGGKSLELVSPFADPANPANWRASHYRGGSPGSAGEAPARAGDHDGDDDVDGNDFLVWQRGLGTPPLQASASMGDSDGDRDVDAADLGAWRQNFSASLVASRAAAEVYGGVAGEALQADEWIAAAEVDAARPRLRPLYRPFIDSDTLGKRSTLSAVSGYRRVESDRQATGPYGGHGHEAVDEAFAHLQTDEAGLAGQRAAAQQVLRRAII